MPIEVPQRLVDACNSSRPMCIFYKQKNAKKGSSALSGTQQAMTKMTITCHTCRLRRPRMVSSCALCGHHWMKAGISFARKKGVPRRALTGSVKITDGNNVLRMYQLGFMSQPGPAAKQAMLSNGIHMWSCIKNEWKKTWHGAAQRINLEGFFRPWYKCA